MGFIQAIIDFFMKLFGMAKDEPAGLPGGASSSASSGANAAASSDSSSDEKEDEDREQTPAERAPARRRELGFETTVLPLHRLGERHVHKPETALPQRLGAPFLVQRPCWEHGGASRHPSDPSDVTLLISGPARLYQTTA